MPTDTTHDPRAQAPKDAPPKFDPASNPAYAAFKKTADQFLASVSQLASAIKTFEPSADPRDIDKTSGLSDIASSMSALRGSLDELTRRISAGPGGGVGGYAPGYAPKTMPDTAPPASDPGFHTHDHQQPGPPAKK